MTPNQRLNKSNIVASYNRSAFCLLAMSLIFEAGRNCDEGQYEPPAGELRIVESYLVPFKLASRRTQILQLARLTLDSFDRQALEGIRGFDIVSRQLMYQCGEVYVDMRLEPKAASNLMILAGQVVDSREAEGGLAGIPISLLSEGNIMFDVTTNQLGEFQFSFQPARQLELLIGIKDTALLVLVPDDECGAS
jgi:hypothetical protein